MKARTTALRKTLHCKMWDEIAEKHLVRKIDTLTIQGIHPRERPVYLCFACEEAVEQARLHPINAFFLRIFSTSPGVSAARCKFCPLDRQACKIPHSAFARWSTHSSGLITAHRRNTDNLDDKWLKLLAIRIRDSWKETS